MIAGGKPQIAVSFVFSSPIGSSLRLDGTGVRSVCAPLSNTQVRPARRSSGDPIANGFEE